MKKIIVILQQLEAGGLEKAVISLVNALSEREDYKIFLYIFLKSIPIISISERIHVNFKSNRKLKNETRLEKYIRKLHELYSVRKISKKIHDSIIISTRNEYTKIISKNADNTNFIIAQLHNDYSKKEFHDFCSKYKNVDIFVQLNDTFKAEIEPVMRKKNCFTKLPVIPNFIEKKYF